MENRLTIEIPQGHEIDLSKSDLSKGLVVFKKLRKLSKPYDKVT